MIEHVRALLRPLQRRVMLLFSRGIVRLSDDSGPRQTLQLSLLAGELRGDVEHWQTYGFSSNPLNGAGAIVGCVGGNRDHPIALCVSDPRTRPRNLAKGEVAMWDDQGTMIVLRRGGVVEITSASKIRIVAPVLELAGDLEVSGSVRDHAGTIDEVRIVYNAHTHPGGAGNPPAPQMPIQP